ncbi:ectoine/hydroxyectoine ABC transporter substrate-binding protein EhuB [Pararhodospirillum oryzae]|uniref:ectoine/hydroxyectoine ABC transporter substrate-binding protein EhuB n=1 Tax=Pararhodospirillum oryzae TaxID=478448 RepID=UPI0014790682|nr:ectoine/hydroxyectoine ABC transporter substrate-binding protein EhuB [Pararhodospirillum oryzae]
MVLLALGLALTLAVGATLYWAPGAPERTWDRIARTGTIRVGYAWEPPFAYRDETGRVTGESPEVARVVLDRLGVLHVDWVQTSFGDLIPDLLTGRFDLIASGLFIRPDRARVVAFSPPSSCVVAALLVRAGNPLALHSLADIAASSNARLAVVSGAVEENDALASGVPSERLLRFPDADLALAGVLHGAADALALTGPTIQHMANTHPQVERARPFSGESKPAGCTAFAFRPKDELLRQHFDQFLLEFRGTPAHQRLVAPFGFADSLLFPESPESFPESPEPSSSPGQDDTHE